MPNLTAHHLRFALEVQTTIELNRQPGSGLRGMLFHALRGPLRNPALGFCTQRHLKTCAECALVAACPVASLVSTLNPAAGRGRDVPRPYAITPPLAGKTRYEPGETLSFGLTLFGHALNLFPYIIMALRQAERLGLGKKLPRSETGERRYRGQFQLRAAQAVNLLTGEVQDIMEAGNSIVQRPELPVTHAQILEMSQRILNPPIDGSTNGRDGQSTYQRIGREGLVDITLAFKTPTRIVEQKRLLKAPHFTPIFHRLLDRLDALNREFAGGGIAQTPARGQITQETAPFDKQMLLSLTGQVELVTDRTRWQEGWSYSARQGRKTPLGGLAGQATYRARADVWTKLLPWLLWGTVTHVGKSAVKGNGMIAVSMIENSLPTPPLTTGDSRG